MKAIFYLACSDILVRRLKSIKTLSIIQLSNSFKCFDMEKVGYARVSSVGQNLDTQVAKLKEAGCSTIYQEKISGLDQNRPTLKECLNYLRKGDTLVITKLDRLARSAVDLGKLVERFDKENIGFVVLDQNIDTTTPTGKLLFHMLSAFAEFENNLRKERQVDGIKNALNNGVKFGRPPKLNTKLCKAIFEDRQNGRSISELCDKYQLGQASIFRALRKMQKSKS